MKHSKLEQNIKDKMVSFSADVDTDALWDNLSEHVPEKKEKRVFPYFSSAIVLFVASLILFYFSNLNYNKSILENQENNNQIAKNYNKEISKTPIAKKVNNSKLDIHEVNMGKNDLDMSNTISQLHNNDQIQKETKDEIDKNNTVKTTNNKTFPINNINQNSQSYYSSQTREQSVIEDESKKIKELKSDNVTVISLSGNKSIEVINNTNTDNIINNTVIPKINILALLPISRFQTKEKTLSFVLLPKIVNSHYFSLDLGFRLGYFNQNNKARTKESIAYVEDFNNFSTTRPIYGITLGLQYNFNKKWYAKTGLDLSTFATKLHSKWTRENKYTNINLVTLKSQTNYEAIGHLYSYTIDIPIMLGYSFYNKYNWKISSEAGILLNLKHISKGQTLDEASKLTDIQSSTYPRGFKLGLHFGMKFSYKLSPQMNAFFNPLFTYRTTDYQYNTIKMNQNFSTYNMNIGIKYKL